MSDPWYYNQQYQPSLQPDTPQNQYSYQPTPNIPAEYSAQWNQNWDPQQYYLPAPYPEVNGPPYGLTQTTIPTAAVNQHYGYDSSQRFSLPAPYNEPRRGSERTRERVDFITELEEYRAAKRAKTETDNISSFLTGMSSSTYSSLYRSRSISSSKTDQSRRTYRSRGCNRSETEDRNRSHRRSHSRGSSRSHRRSHSHDSSRSHYRNKSRHKSKNPYGSRSPRETRSRPRSKSFRRSGSRHGSISSQPSRSRVPVKSLYRSRSPSKNRRPETCNVLTQELEGSSRTEYKSKDQQSVSRLEKDSKKSLSERDEILDKWKKNYCNTELKITEKLEEYSKKTEDIVNTEKSIWTRSTPAEIYYTRDDANFRVFKGTQKLIDLVSTFKGTLVDRAAKVNALKPEYVAPPRRTRTGLCKHKSEISSSDSESSDATLSDEEDFSMEELQRKQQHPDRLDPEMWYNDPGEMNDGPLCRCSHKSRKSGIRHEIYPGEKPIPKCDIYSNNGGKLYYYRIIISPPTNFLIKAPTIIHHDEHEFIFEGFSILSHFPLAKLPPCKVIRFNIEYTILYYEEKMPENFTVSELDLFITFLFREVLELVDLDLTTPLDSEHCSQFHFMPRFVRELPDNGKEILCMQQVLQYLLNSSVPLIQKCDLESMVKMSQFEWQNFADELKGMVVTYPGKKPSSVRVDQLDRNIDLQKKGNYKFPEIVHFGIRPPQLSYAGNPEYQKAWREYVKFRHLIANMSKPTFDDKRKLESKENKLQEMRTQGQMKRDVTVAVSAEGFYRTGIMCDIVQHAMLIPVLVCHLRFHNSLTVLEESVNYKFENRGLLQLALTHPSYRENFGTNPDHARNSLTNCGIRQPEYGDRRIHYMNTRKRGINTLINIMSRFGKQEETESNITHNERLEFLGDAVVEFLSSIHLFFSFPHLEEGGLATYRAAIVQNQHLALLARVLKLDQFMLYAHGSDLCHDLELKHAMANCFEALMGALFLDGGIDVADRVFSNTLYKDEPDLHKVWVNLPPHPLQEQEPLGDRHWIEKFEILQKLTGFEQSINVEFNHIRLLARAFTDRSVGYTNLTMGSNQRLEFLGDTVLQLIASEYLYRYFPEHHEGHLSLLRSSLVNNRTQAVVCDDLGMSQYALYNNPKPELKTKDRADLLEALIGALYVDQGMEYCEVFCQVTLFPRLQDFIMNQDWNDPKSKLQQCCLTLRTMDGGEPDIPVYKVIECKGPTNTRVYTVAVYFRARRLASAMGHSIQQAEMNAAKKALEISHDLFPQLDHQKRVIAKSMKKQKKNKYSNKVSNFDRDRKSPESYSRNRFRSKSPSVRSDSRNRFRSKSRSVRSDSKNRFRSKSRSVRSDSRNRFRSKSPSVRSDSKNRFRSKSPSVRSDSKNRFRTKSPSVRSDSRNRLRSKSRSVRSDSRNRFRSKTPSVRSNSKNRFRSKSPSVRSDSRNRFRSQSPSVRSDSKNRFKSKSPSVRSDSKNRFRTKSPSVRSDSRNRLRSKSRSVRSDSRNRFRSKTPSLRSNSKNRFRSKSPSVMSDTRNRFRSKSPLVRSDTRNRFRSKSPSAISEFNKGHESDNSRSSKTSRFGPKSDRMSLDDVKRDSRSKHKELFLSSSKEKGEYSEEQSKRRNRSVDNKCRDDLRSKKRSKTSLSSDFEKEKRKKKQSRSKTHCIKKQSSKDLNLCPNESDSNSSSDKLNSSTETVKGKYKERISYTPPPVKEVNSDKSKEELNSNSKSKHAKHESRGSSDRTPAVDTGIDSTQLLKEQHNVIKRSTATLSKKEISCNKFETTKELISKRKLIKKKDKNRSKSKKSVVATDPTSSIQHISEVDKTIGLAKNESDGL